MESIKCSRAVKWMALTLLLVYLYSGIAVSSNNRTKASLATASKLPTDLCQRLRSAPSSTLTAIIQSKITDSRTCDSLLQSYWTGMLLSDGIMVGDGIIADGGIMIGDACAVGDA
jgi:hypothetical protein